MRCVTRTLTVAATAAAAAFLATAPASATPTADSAAPAPHVGTQPVGGPVSPMIIGGEDADQTYTFMASLQTSSGGDHSCGASLIDSEWLVTAAHCVEGESPADWQLRVGTTDYSSGGEVVTPDEFIPHPDYPDVGADIALIHLASPATSTPVGIGTATPADQSTLRLLGWGLTCPVRGCGDVPLTLQQLDSTVLADSECDSWADQTGQPYGGAGELCLDTAGGTASSCYGDSGGPALALVDGEYVLVGDTSRGFVANCLLSPGVYTDVTQQRDWIARVTGLSV